MVRHVFLSLFLLLTGVFTSASAADWQTYQNHEHGFSIDYPAGIFTTRAPSEDGEGVTFSNPEKSLRLSIYGFQNGDELPMKTVRDIIVENYADRDVTYERLTKNWIVLSGYENPDGERTIFYHRLAINKAGDRFSVFEFKWPESRRSEIDPLLKRMSRSLTSPKAK